jgi:hypothetical protein
MMRDGIYGDRREAREVIARAAAAHGRVWAEMT